MVLSIPDAINEDFCGIIKHTDKYKLTLTFGVSTMYNEFEFKEIENYGN